MPLNGCSRFDFGRCFNISYNPGPLDQLLPSSNGVRQALLLYLDPTLTSPGPFRRREILVYRESGNAKRPISRDWSHCCSRPRLSVLARCLALKCGHTFFEFRQASGFHLCRTLFASQWENPNHCAPCPLNICRPCVLGSTSSTCLYPREPPAPHTPRTIFRLKTRRPMRRFTSDGLMDRCFVVRSLRARLLIGWTAWKVGQPSLAATEPARGFRSPAGL